MKKHILNGVMGLAVADALGVPVEFKSRDRLVENPVTSMRGYGTFHQPAGTWSDDTSMTLCLVDSLSERLDYQDIMESFSQWMTEGKYTPFGRPFGVGNGTNEAVMRFKQGVSPLECGGTTEQDNGNGSLMRTLPVLYYLRSTYGVDFLEDDNAFEVIHNISRLTHGHKRSHVACGIYIAIGSMLLQENDIDSAVKQGISKAMYFYEDQADYADELSFYNRLKEDNFAETSIDDIKSSGYVVDTLEAAIWCLLTTESYEKCVLKAVNLGVDTDTVAAVAGGLAGLHYGYESIPAKWLETLVEREYIEDLCEQFSSALLKSDVEKLIAYIPYFETATRDSALRWASGEKLGEKHFVMPNPIYDKILINFIDDFYETDLVFNNYNTFFKEIDFNETEVLVKIAVADLDYVRAILTGYVRQERFMEGLWGIAVENKIFLKILERLKVLTE